MKTQMIILAAAAASLVACTKETPVTPAEKQQITLSVDCGGTKTSGITEIKFKTDDKLSVFDSNCGNNEFAQEEGSEAAAVSATFKGSVSAGSTPTYVVYPYTASGSIDASGNVTVTLPSHYVPSDKNSILNGMGLSIGQMSESGEGYSASLKNVCGIVGVHIDSAFFGITNIKLSANEALTGTVTFNYNGGDPSVTNVTDGQTSIDFDAMHEEDNYIAAGKFYFAVLPGTYTGIKLTISYASGKTKEIASSNPLTVTRGGRTLLPLTLAQVQETTGSQMVIQLGGNNQQLYVSDGTTTSYLPTTETSTSGIYYMNGYGSANVCAFPIYLHMGSEGTYRYYSPKKSLYFKNAKTSGSYITCPAVPGYYLKSVGVGCTASTQKIWVSNVLTDKTSSLTQYKEITPGIEQLGTQATVSTVLGTDKGKLYYIYFTTDTNNMTNLKLVYAN